MYRLAIKMALRDWKKVGIVSLVMSFSGSMYIYFNLAMRQIRLFAINNAIADDSKLNGLTIPQTRAETVIAAMSLLIVLAAALFQLNMLVVDMINKKKEYNGLKVIGVSEENVELFPLFYAMSSAILSSVIIAVTWFIAFPYFKDIIKLKFIAPGLIILVIIIFFTLSVIIGVKARYVAEYMHK